jgi:hypothetical protein
MVLNGELDIHNTGCGGDKSSDILVIGLNRYLEHCSCENIGLKVQLLRSQGGNCGD